MQSTAETWLAFRRSPAEQKATHVLVPTLCLAGFGVCALAQAQIVPAWVAFVANAVLTITISALGHELVHERPADVDRHFLTRLNLHIYTPLSLGFSELRALHLLHHQDTNGGADPDYPLIKDGKLRAFLRLAFMPEHWFFYAIKHRLVSADFWQLWAIRAVILAGFIYWVGLETYLVLYLLPVKIATAVLYLLFSYEAHTDDQGEPRGTYNFRPKWVVPGSLARYLVGRVACNGSYYHATHHRYPWISGNRLHTATEWLQKKQRFPVRRRLV